VSPHRVGFAITMCYRSCTERISISVGLVTEIPGAEISHSAHKRPSWAPPVVAEDAFTEGRHRGVGSGGGCS